MKSVLNASAEKSKSNFAANNVFELSFESENPEKAKQVTSRLALCLLTKICRSENSRPRGPSPSLMRRRRDCERNWKQQETVVNQYKVANRYELPDQLDTNLRSLEQLRRELEANNQRLAALQERKGILQKQTVESDILGMDLLGWFLVRCVRRIGITENVQIQMKKERAGFLAAKIQ